MAVENVYFESTDGLLAEKTTTQDRLPDVGFSDDYIFVCFSIPQLCILFIFRDVFFPPSPQWGTAD